MNEIEATDGLGVLATLEQMIRVLGFHDWASFLMTSTFLILALAFIVSLAIFFVKKRRERKSQLLKVVHEVQKEFDEPGEPKPLDEPSKLENLAPQIKLPEEKAPIKKVAEKPREEKKPVITVKTKASKPSVPAPKVEEKPPVQVKPSLEPKPLVEAKAPAEVKPSVETKPVVQEVPELKPVEVKAKPEAAEPQKSLGSALTNTRLGFIAKLGRLFGGGKAQISDEDFEEMEAILFTADIGVKTAQKLLDGLKERVKSAKAVDKSFLHQALKEEMHKIFQSTPKKPSLDQSPQVIMFVGVNGAGKTTSVGKLGARLAQEGKKVVFAAGDTFRAAAVEQLALWGKRSDIEVVYGKENADSASVLFEGIERGKAVGADYILCDTAGRLHTKLSLMEELSKVHRVVGKALPGAPHEVFLVIDATMGQNAIAQAREFLAATPLTGVILSKLDGTAKGGVALGIVDDLKVPIRFVGIGEKASDLKDFDAEEFVNALLEDA